MLDGEFDILITCASGIEKVLKSELVRLGFTDAPAINGGILVRGNQQDVARLNVNLRTADRVYIRLASFAVETFDQLFDGVKSIRWKDVIPKNGRVKVNGKCVKSKLFAISACQSIVKKAVVDNLCNAHKTTSLPETGATYEIDFSIFKDQADILLNTSGVGLHKRGYKDLVWIAPIKETLASAMVLLSDYYYKKPFADPFCGSGTIAIECAKIALNIAPNTQRKFDFDGWNGFDQNARKIAIEQAIDLERRDREVQIIASDIDPKAVKLARRHAERAGLKGVIDFRVCDVKNFRTDLSDGTIVTNPPYGERVYDREEAEACYKSLGGVFKELDDWSLFAITSAKNFEKCFGKKADRNRKLYNSEKECRLYYYYKTRR